MREAGGKREQNEFTKQSNWNWNTCTKAARPAPAPSTTWTYVYPGGGVALGRRLTLCCFACLLRLLKLRAPHKWDNRATTNTRDVPRRRRLVPQTNAKRQHVPFLRLQLLLLRSLLLRLEIDLNPHCKQDNWSRWKLLWWWYSWCSSPSIRHNNCGKWNSKWRPH